MRQTRPGHWRWLLAIAAMAAWAARGEVGEARPDPGDRTAVGAAPSLLPAPDPLDPTPRPDRPPTPTPDPAFTPEIIGHSVAGRPLEVYRFGSGTRVRMLVAGIHGGYEWNTIALAHELIAELQARPQPVPPDRTLYILPALNPDGAARSNSYAGRANDHGVDLNRNWPVRWLPDWPRAGCWAHLPIGAGPDPASEPETRALMSFLLERRVEALVSYHSAALGVFAGLDPDHAPSLDLAARLAEATGYPYPPIDTGCLYTGQLVDWAAASGIAAVDVELSTHWSTDLRQNLALLAVFLAWEP